MCFYIFERAEASEVHRYSEFRLFIICQYVIVALVNEQYDEEL